MHYHTIKTVFVLLCLSGCFFLSSCDSSQTNTATAPTTQTDTPPTSVEPNKEEIVPSVDKESISGTYVYKHPNSTKDNGNLVLKQLDNGRIKFELDLNNGPPNYHTGTATGELELNGNSAVFTTSEYAMGEDEKPCAISFMFVKEAVELNQAQGSDMSCGFGQGVVATGIYNKKNNKVIFRYEGGH